MSDFEKATPVTEDEMDDIRVELELDDKTVQCKILTIFETEGQDYIALLPLDENGEEPDEGEVYIYRYFEDEEGNPSLENIEDEDEYRTNAPTSYLKSYTTAVKDTYVERIMKESPILLDKIQIGTSTSFVADQYDKAIGASIIENVSNEISTISESITITAVKANGDKLSDTEADELLKTVTQKIGNVKGPNDFFSYKEPNFIKLAPSIKITSSDIATKEEDIRQEVSQAISNNFSIFSVDFNNNRLDFAF